MSTVITVMNMKGGVGKTTVTAHVAGMLALYEFKDRRRNVLMIDYDPQFNLSQMYLSATNYFELVEQRKTSLAILQDDETRVNPYVLQVPGNRNPPDVKKIACSINDYLDLVPSSLDLMYIALGQTDKRTDAFEERFAKFIRSARDRYDVVLIDCHPAGSILTKTSLSNSDHVLIPVVPSQFASRGVDLMREFIDKSRKGSTSTPYHILFNYAGNHSSSSAETTIRTSTRHAHRCLLRTLKRYKAYSDPTGGRGFVWYSKAPYSDKAFRSLRSVVDELVVRLSL